MGRNNIDIFGTKFVMPHGLRKSPGVSSYNSCIAAKLSGQTGGGREGQKQRFREAVNKCKSIEEESIELAQYS